MYTESRMILPGPFSGKIKRELHRAALKTGFTVFLLIIRFPG